MFILGYYYDNEINLYYLQSRYYDPQTHRFINIDSIEYLDPENINWLNLFAYCRNNPVVRVDYNGNAWWDWLITGITLTLGAVLCFVPGAQGLGVSLLVAGGSMLASNIMSAAGVDSKLASIISCSLDIVAGIALCYTPFASIGASMIGSGVLWLTGGFISESLGGSFALGSAIGSIAGSIIGWGIYKAYDNYKIGKIAKQRIVVVGETMTRVNNYADKIGAGTFKASGFVNWVYSHNHKLGSALTMSENMTWIPRVCQLGVGIANIGINVMSNVRSKFYAMEILNII